MADLSIPTDAPVLVTGATGYVAGWVVQRLLDAGVSVHATVRDAANAERLAYLSDMARDRPGSIRFFEADLLDAGSFTRAMEGCAVVFHIASPYVLDVKDPQKELVDPALEGTRNVLRSVEETPTVTRVVLTSSCAAIYGDNIDLEATPRGVFEESVWNTTSSLEHNAYSYSKTLAEREAWKLAEGQERWRLVVMNPAGVFGPGVRYHPSSESFRILTQLGDGTMGSGAPDIRLGLVDVRDVADAHIRGAFLPDAEGRHVLVGHDTGVMEIAKHLAEHFDGYRFPPRILPKFVLWLVGPFVNSAITRTFVSRNIGLPWKSDSSKSQQALGVTYRPLAETAREHFQQLVDEGAVKAR